MDSVAPDQNTIDSLLWSRPAADMAIATGIKPLIDQMLGDGYSVLDPSTRIWTPEAAEEIRARVEDNPIEGTEDNQWEKLDQQLAGASRESILLAAEMVFLRGHGLKASLPESRRANVERVLSYLEEPLTIPEPMASWLARPANTAGFNPGPWYNQRLWLHLPWLCHFVQHWASLDGVQKDAARHDSWELQRVMLASGRDRSDMRNTLQFFARPDTFEPISAATMKQKIRAELGPCWICPASVQCPRPRCSSRIPTMVGCVRKAAFAALAGVNPIPASSGNTTRHRLNRHSDRQLNRAMYTIAQFRMIYDPTTIAHVERRTSEGKTLREIRRCVKRFIARQLFRRLQTLLT